MSRKIVVTGGAGFIGSSLARALIARGDEISVLDNFSTGRRENLQDLAGTLAVVEGDILDAALLDRVFAGAEVVFHEAAIPSVPRSLAARQPQCQRHGHAQRPGGCASLSSSAGGLCRILLGLW
jgi:nucleoside-diphosphate-sugar epimerase